MNKDRPEDRERVPTLEEIADEQRQQREFIEGLNRRLRVVEAEQASARAGLRLRQEDADNANR